MSATSIRVQNTGLSHSSRPVLGHRRLAMTHVRLACAQGQIFELKDGAGIIAPIVLKAAKKAALISDLEREWGVGQKVATLADDNGNLPGFMKVGPALRRPDGKIVGDRPAGPPP